MSLKAGIVFPVRKPKQKDNFYLKTKIIMKTGSLNAANRSLFIILKLTNYFKGGNHDKNRI